ncbi:ATP-binding protein [Acinetobacter baumannii]|uniref:AAA family ATPase n=1 Tax=Acinetobacter baumannii TaxID=470 RepID=A0A9P2LGB5_ACIBA|nr:MULTISPECIES: ATP-binding protein [Acinetobacter calcoaceticus/baumannii complex]EKT9125628.1 ATP-binding protein [Acinetobacter baumannii]EKT9273323.1 ATP-binding protein [Acinetobacter baumannii]EKT9294545.1 ATP-binding protein [Acinetobacter baumannii]EKT9315380.1 ATP-binding protein [Acinetobacter baumannii]EKU0110616.1 ATP-binding protein [Acinetobacter baumannii]
MAAQIILPHEVMPVNNIVLYMYGPPSMWKSSIGQSAVNALHINADNGMHRVSPKLRRNAVLNAERWNDVYCLTEQDLTPYKTIVIDTVGTLLEMIRAEFAENPNNTHSFGGLKQHIYGIVNNRFSEFVSRLIRWGKDVVFIAHAAEDKNEEKVIIRPEIGGKSRQELYRLSDAMAYLCFEKQRNGALKRVLRFSANDEHHAKDCANLRTIDVPNLNQNPTFLGDLIEHIKKELNTMTPEQVAYQENLQTWIHWQKSCNEAQYASEFNDLMLDLKKYVDDEHPWRQEMWHCLKAAATAKELTHDKTLNTWREVQAAV